MNKKKHNTTYILHRIGAQEIWKTKLSILGIYSMLCFAFRSVVTRCTLVPLLSTNTLSIFWARKL